MLGFRLIRTIIFDFDGVILETVDIKLSGFLYLFRDYPEPIREKVARLHLDNGGMPRYEKFRIIYEVFLKRKLLDSELRRLDEEFGSFCYKAILEAPFVPGIYQFLASNHARYDLWIVSGAPEVELKRIVKERQLNSYFRDVFGFPRTKAELCGRILKQSGGRREEVVMVGDSLTDLEGAEANGIKFVARIHTSNRDLFKDGNIVRCNDFEGFETVLKKLGSVGK